MENISRVSIQRLLKEYVLVFAVAVLVYALCCAPSLEWQDSGMIQYRVLNNDIRGGLGLALAHPLFYLIAILFKNIPLCDVIYRINLVSSLAGAFAVANVYLLMRNWLGRIFPAIITAISLGFSHTFFQHACMPETYTLYICLLSAELIAIESYFRTGKTSRLYFVAVFNGLAIATHMLAVLSLSCYAVIAVILIVKKKIKLANLIAIVLLWIAGASAYLYLIAEYFAITGDLAATLKSAAFGSSWQHDVLNASLTGRIVLENIMYIGMNFPTPTALLGFVGIAFAWRRASHDKFAVLILVLTVVYLGFAFRYTVPDRYAFFIAFYMFAAILIGMGTACLDCIFESARARRSLTQMLRLAMLILALIPVGIYKVLPVMVEKHYPIFKNKRQLPYRDEYQYFLVPWNIGNRSAECFAQEALKSVEPGSIIMSDGTALYPLVITQQLKQQRPDVDIISGHGSYDNLSGYSKEQVGELLRSRPAYIVSPVKGYCPDFILEEFDFEKAGVLYRIVTRSR